MPGDDITLSGSCPTNNIEQCKSKEAGKNNKTDNVKDINIFGNKFCTNAADNGVMLTLNNNVKTGCINKKSFEISFNDKDSNGSNSAITGKIAGRNVKLKKQTNEKGVQEYDGKLGQSKLNFTNKIKKSPIFKREFHQYNGTYGGKEFSVEVKVPFMQTIDDTTFSGKYDGKDVRFSSNVNFVIPDDIKFAESIPSEFKDVAILLMAIHDKNSDKTQE